MLAIQGIPVFPLAFGIAWALAATILYLISHVVAESLPEVAEIELLSPFKRWALCALGGLAIPAYVFWVLPSQIGSVGLSSSVTLTPKYLRYMDKAFTCQPTYTAD